MFRTPLYVALCAMVAVLLVSCGGDDNDGGSVKPQFVPADSITVTAPLKRSRHHVLVSNTKATGAVKLTSLRILDDVNKPLEELEVDGVRHYRLDARDAEYYFRVDLDTEFLVIRDASSLEDVTRAASIVAADGSQLCNEGDMPVDLSAPNWCDMLAGTSILETSVMKLNGSYTLPTASGATLTPLLHPDDSNWEGYAAEIGIGQCGDGGLSVDGISHQDPWDTEDIWKTVDGNRGLDYEKLMGFCETRPGVWNAQRLSLSVSSMKFAHLPLVITTWAVPNSDVAEVPARSFFLSAEYEGGSSPVKMTIRFNSAVAGNPEADLIAPAENVYALDAVQLDGRTSYSPLGAQREPLEYFWTARPVDEQNGLPPVILPPDGDPAVDDSIAGVWTDEGLVDAWLPLVGEYVLSLKVRDNTGLESEVAEHTVNAAPQGRLYAQLAWDTDEAEMELFFVRYRPQGSCMVPPAEDDIVNPPSGITCNNDLQCNVEGEQYFCAGLADGSQKCTFHPDAAHNDTCFADNPNPNWGDSQSPDDDPKLVASWNPPGPKAIAVDRPAPGLYRLVVKLLPTSPRSLDKENPANTRLTIFASGTIVEVEQPMYFRPPSEEIFDIPVWKVLDVEWPDSGSPVVTPLTVQSQDCFNPADCPYANPGNSVVDVPYDPHDPNRPRSIWCDEAGDPECVL